MLLEKCSEEKRSDDVSIMETTSRTTSSTSKVTSQWQNNVIKPVPERPEPVYPIQSVIRPEALSLKSGPENNTNMRVNSLSTLMGLPTAPSQSMYPFLQLPLGAPKYLPFGPLLYHSKYPLGKKTFHCPQCRYVTDRKNNLKRHIATMHQDCGKPLECCEIHFKSKAALRDHVMMFHRAGYKCRFCGRNFCRKALLKRHLAVHNGQKDFICSVCDYATSHKSNLERHKKVHGQGTYSDDEDLDVHPEGMIDVEGLEPHPLHQNLMGMHPLSSLPHSHHLQMLRSHQFHHSHLLNLAAAANSQSANIHSSLNNHFSSQPASRDKAPEDLSPGTSGSRTPDAPSRTPPVQQREDAPISRASSSRSASPEVRPVTPPEVNQENAKDSHSNDVTAALYRFGPKRLFGSPYKCSECTLSFASQIQLAIHSRECKSGSNPVTSLPLPMSWPPYPLMLPSNPMNVPLMSTLPLSGLNPNFSNLNPFKHRQATSDSNSPIKPTFWPFALQPRDLMTSRYDITSTKDDVTNSLPPKKRSMPGSEPTAMDFRASTLSAAPTH